MKRTYETFSEEALTVLDFARCQRADGSYYGTAGQCRKGKEVGPREIKMLKDAAAKGNKKAQIALDVVEGRKSPEDAAKELRTINSAKSAAAAPKEEAPKKEEEKPKAKEEASKKDDPNAPLADRFESAKPLGSGGYAEVRLTDSGTVIKKGELGYGEVATQKALEGVDGIPKIKKQEGNIVEMEMARGKPIMDTDLIGADKPTKLSQQAAEEFIRLNKEMHTRNIAHGDQHDGNFFFDVKSGKGGMIDFGQSSSDSPWAALEEGLKLGSSSDYKSGNMLSELAGSRGADGVARSNAGPKLSRFEANQQKLFQKLKAEGYDPDDGLEGVGIPRDQAEAYIKELYDGV